MAASWAGGRLGTASYESGEEAAWRARPAAFLPLRAVLAGLAGLIGLTTLVGYAFGIDLATRWTSGAESMKPNSAVAVLVLAACTVVPRRAARFLAVVPLLLGVVTLVEYAAHVSGTGFDTLFHPVHEPGQHPARTAVLGALCFALLAVAYLLPPDRFRVLVESLALAVVTISSATMLGYLYGVHALYTIGPSSSVMALHTAIALFLLGGALLASVPGGAATGLVHAPDAGAVLLRRLLPVVLLAVPAAGYVVLSGHVAGRYDDPAALCLVVLVSVLLVGVTTWYTARRLTDMDDRRGRAVTALTAVNAELEERVQERVDELEEQQAHVAVLDDRQRIAADMHDHVIQGLYAVALGLQASQTRGESSGAHDEAVDRALDGIDDAIRELRASIFELKYPATAGDLAGRLQRLLETMGDPLAHTVTVRGSAPRGAMSDFLAENILAVAREGLSNAVRHAAAAHVDVVLDLGPDGVELTVTDDGTGIDPKVRSTSGMQNMRGRAERLGGSCTWKAVAPHGTRVTWRAPLRESPARRPSGARIGRPLEEALLTCSRVLATSTPREALGRVCDVAADLLGADHVSVGVAAGDEMRLVHAAGLPGDANPTGLTMPRDSSLAGYVMDSRQPLKIDGIADLPAAIRLFGKLPFGPAIMVPLVSEDEPLGTFALARRKGEAKFTVADLEHAEVLSLFVRLAVEVMPRGAATGERPRAEPRLGQQRSRSADLDAPAPPAAWDVTG